ncbi:MAG: hypothetical protein LBG62_06820 [Candidatus Methanoplasma sp.]|jgi:hypothetical protein|nr:hypothetical protein [Candidatus Methanoplasma sp.]
MEYDTLSLRALIESCGEYSAQSRLDSFRCRRDLHREAYLRNSAMPLEKREMSRTYLIVSKSDEIWGYYSLGMKCLEIRDDAVVSSSMRRKMNVNEETGVAQSYLLGQLGRSDDSPKGLGEMMLADALDIFRDANLLIGCRMVRLDCSADLVPYYKKHGFVKIGRSRSKDLDQLVMIL